MCPDDCQRGSGVRTRTSGGRPRPRGVSLTPPRRRAYGQVMRKRWLLGLLLATLVLLGGGAAFADSDQTTAPSARQADVPVVLSIRASSLQAPLVDTGETERVTAPTCAGSSRWPSASTPIGRGVYLSVMPACIPGVDEPLWPGTPRAGRRR